VPFCERKCAYCDFASYAGREADIPHYVDAVVKEIARRGTETGRLKVDTIFLGGGTPSLLDESMITRILGAFHEAFSIEEHAEITCECNPGTLGVNGNTNSSLPPPLFQSKTGVRSASFVQTLRKAGVNRLSIGAQARQERLLHMIGRIHRWEQVIASVEIARDAGYENINLDLMFGLPSQTISDLQATLDAAIALSPTHLSCYGLVVEQGTPIHRDIAAEKLVLPNENVERDMYELVRQTLIEHGFYQYEISNFARDGYECRHNIHCWTRVPYLGFGCAAHSFFDECRTMNPANLDAYLAGEEPQVEHISKEEARFESLMLGLRMTRGVKDEDFTRMHGMTIREAFGDKLDRPIVAGLVKWYEEALCLTRLGMDLQNSVLVDLM
jgi:oxygen-independent coproporphyrinogen-3 oxidase